MFRLNRLFSGKTAAKQRNAVSAHPSVAARIRRRELSMLQRGIVYKDLILIKYIWLKSHHFSQFQLYNSVTSVEGKVLRNPRLTWTLLLNMILNLVPLCAEIIWVHHYTWVYHAGDQTQVFGHAMEVPNQLFHPPPQSWGRGFVKKQTNKQTRFVCVKYAYMHFPKKMSRIYTHTHTNKRAGQWWFTPLIPALGGQR